MKNYYNIINPFNNNIIGEAPIHSKKEIQNILDQSYKYKCDLLLNEKLEILESTILSFENEKNEIANLITLETGLAISAANHEVERAKNCLKYCIIELEKSNNINLNDDYHIDKNNRFPELSVFEESLDLAIGITPFNHPLNLVVHKVGPAIVAGTPIVIKPSEKTPLTALKLREILVKNKMPKNLFNIISGMPPKNIVDQILKYKNYDLVSFTGGISIGKYIAKKMVNSGNELKKYIPELGGNAVFVVMDDCDINFAAQLAMGAFENSGQRCTAIRRILLHRKISTAFLEKFVYLTSQIKYGDPFNLDIEMGTVISSDQARLIHERVNSAINDGANLLIGNKINGALFSPTILSNVSQTSEIVQRETFGPVVSIIEIDDLDDAINYIKQDRFGLASGIVTNSREKAYKLYRNICVGQFSWNGRPGYRTEDAPFGGFKDSGNGEKEGIVLMTRAMKRIRTFYEHERN